MEDESVPDFFVSLVCSYSGQHVPLFALPLIFLSLFHLIFLYPRFLFSVVSSIIFSALTSHLCALCVLSFFLSRRGLCHCFSQNVNAVHPGKIFPHQDRNCYATVWVARVTLHCILQCLKLFLLYY